MRQSEEVVTSAQFIHAVILSLLLNPVLQHGRRMGEALSASMQAPGREDTQLLGDAQAHLDPDEAFSQRSPIATFDGDPLNSHLRLKILSHARAAAALTRTGGVSAGASSTLMFGPRVGPSGPSMR